ncbi:MAG: hypothetical protein WC602_05105 [archaeon]
MNKILFSLIATVIIISCLYSQSEEKNGQVDNFKKNYPGELSIQWDKPSGGPKRMLHLIASSCILIIQIPLTHQLLSVTGSQLC